MEINPEIFPLNPIKSYIIQFNPILFHLIYFMGEPRYGNAMLNTLIFIDAADGEYLEYH